MDRKRVEARQVSALTFDINNAAVPIPRQLLVDTNVWLLVSYSPFSLGPREADATVYNDFLGRCLDDGCQLIRSPFTLPELTHVIEQAEVRAANQRSGQDRRVKQMRWEPNHRRKVIAEVVTAWSQVAGMSSWSPGITVNGDAGEQMFADFRNLKIDGSDLLIVQEALKHGSMPVLSDDFDYLSVPRLSVYTANARAVHAAHMSGKARP